MLLVKNVRFMGDFFIKALHHTYAKDCRKTWLSLQSEQINDLLFSSDISLYLKAYIMYIQGWPKAV